MNDRRKFMLGMLPKAAELVADTVERQVVERLRSQRRPPGAVAEPIFMSLCTRCDDCVTACPHQAIHTFNEDQGGLAGTPVMVPDAKPCLMCEGFPCAVACTTGAMTPPPTTTWNLGKVKIREDLCFAFKGPECGACVGLCPDSIKAITLKMWRPYLEDETCIGCGICIDACPTDPKAIEILPLIDPGFEASVEEPLENDDHA